MGMLSLGRPRPPEDLFVERYNWLLTWALTLTGQDREAAEDLVHEAFLQFTLTRRPDCDGIHNLDAYLYAMLRNLHLSEVRRQARIRSATLPLIDYESLRIGFRYLHPEERLGAREDLAQM